MRKRKSHRISFIFLVLFLLLFCVIFLFFTRGNKKGDVEYKTLNKHKVYAGVSDYLYDYNRKIQIGEIKITEDDYKYGFKEEQVYTFLQGPKSWEAQVPWSGQWSQVYLSGNYFGSFGCGMCCMANIYSTLTDYECSPMDMYDRAIQKTGYSPSYISGAIGWGDLKNCLKSVGFECDVYYKPDDYETFRQQISEAKSSIVLVSSYEDDTYWKDTSGHYVNIWLYDEKNDMVFLAEPGSPTNNRSWIPLKYVYDALKTTSQFQYLMVSDYDEEQNDWKVNGIEDNWTVPEYYQSKSDKKEQ